MNHNIQQTAQDSTPGLAAQTTSRMVLATRIHDLLLREMGQDVDIALMLGPPEYARAVLSLCRSCGSAMLSDLAQQFDRQSAADMRSERVAQQQRIGSGPLRATMGLAARRVFHLS